MRDAFYLFAGLVYYPDGGWADYQGRYPTLSQAKAAFATLRTESPQLRWDWAHVVYLPPDFSQETPQLAARWNETDGWRTPEEEAAAEAKAKAEARAARATLLPCGCAPETPLCTQPGGSCGRCVKHCACTVWAEATAP